MNLQSLEKIVLFGKSRAFSEEEFVSQLKAHKIELCGEYDASVDLVVGGRMLTPHEQNKSDALYKEHAVNSISIDILERELAQNMQENSLLMSLKLSHDKERLKSFIQNSCISDGLFFKLMKMYSWNREDFFENDDNRDVSAAFIARFYKNIERNHNVQYATTGFIHLVGQATSAQLLSEIYDLEPMRYHPKIKMAIAMNLHIDEAMQEKFYKNAEEFILEALSFNKKLSLSLMQKMLVDEALGENIAKTIELDDEKFAKLQAFKSSLAQNISLSETMQAVLIKEEAPEINLALATNATLKEEFVHKLLVSEDEVVLATLYANAATPKVVLQSAYERGIFHDSLAKNENTPVEILYQLQLNSRYERSVKTNKAFGKHIQSENIGWL